MSPRGNLVGAVGNVKVFATFTVEYINYRTLSVKLLKTLVWVIIAWIKYFFTLGDFMRRFFKFLTVWGATLSLTTQADPVKLDNINSDDLHKIVGDFSANFMHTTVSGASSLGDIFGIEVGVVGGVTATPKINEVTQATDPNAKSDKGYYASIIGQVSVPLGFTVEASFLPTVGSEEVKFGTLGLGGKWTPTDVFLHWPFSAALRVFVSKTTAKLHQTISSVSQDLEFVDTQKGFGLVVSKNLGIVEPYFTFGTVSAEGKLSGAAIYNGDLAGETSASATRSSTYWALGLEAKLLVIRLGAEYSNQYDTSRVSGKLSFYF